MTDSIDNSGEFEPTTTGQVAIRIYHTLNVFHRTGDVIEIRILGIPGRGRPHTAAGYFTNFKKAAMCAALYDVSRGPFGIYFVFNRITPELLARSPEQITPYLTDTTSDTDIVRRQWLLIDVDPERKKGIPSSDDELESSRIIAGDIRDWLRDEHGWFEPIEAMSGNGWHLLFPIDLPNDENATATAKATLQAAASRFGGDSTPPGLHPAKVDVSVFNAARITKLYGTVARKGHGIDGRPQRRSELVYVPDYLQPTASVEGTAHVS